MGNQYRRAALYGQLIGHAHSNVIDKHLVQAAPQCRQFAVFSPMPLEYFSCHDFSSAATSPDLRAASSAAWLRLFQLRRVPALRLSFR